MSTSYVTTPIYYVNDLPHIGHIYTTVVGDVVARHRRLAGRDTRFLTGTDEHGQNIERAAREQGLAPIELANKVVHRYHQLWEELAMSHDDFVRTTEARHRPAVEEMIRRIDAAGDLYTAAHEGWYCPACELFYTEKELAGSEAERLCPTHERPVEWKSEENVFFRLSKYQQPLLALYRDHPELVR
ncbi:MAG TPA: class I tRNA ligase family protein, partial [Thermoanaerobaculia bacterium]